MVALEGEGPGGEAMVALHLQPHLHVGGEVKSEVTSRDIVFLARWQLTLALVLAAFPLPWTVG